MISLEKLFEYEDSSLRGIPLSKDNWVKYEPTKQNHHRYHKTKAGLYVILEHEGGKIRMSKFSKGSQSSFSVYPRLGGQNSHLADSFRSEKITWSFNSSANESVCTSHISHYSGLQFHHTVKSSDNSIFAVEISGWTRFEEQDYELPAWRLRIQKKSPESYRSNALPLMEGNIFSYQKHTVEKDGRVVMTPTTNLEGKQLDYAASINNILEKLQIYNPDPEEKEECRTEIAQYLNSLDCLVFK